MEGGLFEQDPGLAHLTAFRALEALPAAAFSRSVGGGEVLHLVHLEDVSALAALIRGDLRVPAEKEEKSDGDEKYAHDQADRPPGAHNVGGHHDYQGDEDDYTRGGPARGHPVRLSFPAHENIIGIRVFESISKLPVIPDVNAFTLFQVSR